MKKIFTTISLTTSFGVAAFAQVTFIFILMGTFSKIQAQTINTPTISNITYNSATLSVYFHPNCTNGGNVRFEWSPNSDFSNAGSSSFSVSNVGFTRTLTLTPLLSSTRYYWRAIGGSGLNCSSAQVTTGVQTFTTLAAPITTLPTISSINSTIIDNPATIFYSLNAKIGRAHV